MIPRYTRSEMARVWSDANKLDSWLKVEIAVCEAWAERGAIPPDAVEKIRGGNDKAIGAIVGAVMKATKGRADGGEVQRIVRERIGS